MLTSGRNHAVLFHRFTETPSNQPHPSFVQVSDDTLGARRKRYGVLKNPPGSTWQESSLITRRANVA